MNNKALRLGLAAVIAAAGMYLLVVLLNSMRPVIMSGFFLIPGQFLYLCFMEAAIYIPLLFLISSFLLIADYYNSKIFTAKMLSLLPFFTFSLLLRVLNYVPGSPAADLIIRQFGVRGGSLFLGLLLIPELLLIARVFFGKQIQTTSTNNVPEKISSVSSGIAVESTASAEAPEHRYEPVPLYWDDEAVEVLQDVSELDEEEPDDEPELEAIELDDELELEAIEPDDEPELEAIEPDDEPEPEVIEPDDEPVVEPLDLDPDAGKIDEDQDVPPAPSEYDVNYPDAPVRGDEEKITQAAREVWADAEQLGFDDVISEPFENDSASAENVNENQEVEVLDSNTNFDLDDGEVSLEIPDVQDIPKESADESAVEVFEEVNDIEDDSPEELLELVEDDEDDFEEDDFEDAIDIDSVLIQTEDRPFEDDEVIAERKEAPAAPDVPALTRRKNRRKVAYNVPVDELLEHYEDDSYWIVDDETREAAEILRQTLEEFKIAAEVTGISKGPVITMFEILPAPGVKLSKIVNLADNIALRLAASRVRIVAPIPGKHAVGIEVPNKSRAIVSFKEILESEDLKKSKMMIPVVLGKDITGGARVIDLVQTPHLLIAGATGSGKSVCVNSLICSILYSRTPDEVKLILIDPKIVELKMYNDIPHLLTPVITEPKRAFQALQYAMCEMERRYTLLNALGVRDIKSYNRRVKDLKLATDLLPYIVIIVDEFADLMATTGKELENVISRLAAMSRAIGIHLVLATQRPSVDVITGLIKANIPSRIAFMVASKTDSRIILDMMGADKLLGKGDMLFTSAWNPNLSRIQGAFLSDDEVERVTDHVKTLGEPDYIDDEMFIDEDENGEFELESMSSSDPLMDTAVSIVVEAGKASASYLQRRLKIGYNRAARLVEDMEERGIVGPPNGSKPREIIHIPDRV